MVNCNQNELLWEVLKTQYILHHTFFDLHSGKMTKLQALAKEMYRSPAFWFSFKQKKGQYFQDDFEEPNKKAKLLSFISFTPKPTIREKMR